MNLNGRRDLSARARPFFRDQTGQEALVALRCGGLQFTLTIDEARRLAAQLDAAADTAEADA
jgi:hypothetical protein